MEHCKHVDAILWTPSCGRGGGLARCSGRAVMGVGEGGQAMVGAAQGAAIVAVQVIVIAWGVAVGGDEQAQGLALWVGLFRSGLYHVEGRLNRAGPAGTQLCRRGAQVCP